MEQQKKELIKGITDLFEDYEEAYVPGEWEAFSQHKKKKYPFLMTWVKVAAMLTLVSSVLFFTLRKPAENMENTAVIHPKEAEQPDEEGKGSMAQDHVRMPGTDRNEASAATHLSPGSKSSSSVAAITAAPANTAPTTQVPSVSNNSINPVSVTPAYAANQTPVSSAHTVIQIPSVSANVLHTDARKVESSHPDSAGKSAVNAAQSYTAANKMKEAVTVQLPAEKQKLSTMDFLTAESKAPAEKAKKKTAGSKWDFGLEVVPSVTQKNTNLGAGLTTAYRLSDKFSLSSGVTMMKMQSGANILPANPDAAVAGFARDISEKELRTVSANIRAIDIPLGLIYKVTKNYYTSIGVSYFNVISEKRSNTYVQTSQVNATVSDPQTGNSFSYKSVITEEVAENSMDEPLRGNSYLGFVNFSIGRKQTIFNKYNILLEPFIKVPVGKLSSQDIKLMNSGLKLQVSF